MRPVAWIIVALSCAIVLFAMIQRGRMKKAARHGAVVGADGSIARLPPDSRIQLPQVQFATV